MVMGTEDSWNVTGGMMTSGISVARDVAGVGVVTGKVAWFGGRV